MNTLINPWDKIGQLFSTKTDEEKANSAAIDNVEIAWPIILKAIDYRFPVKKWLRALDHGCGTGAFTDKLCSLGYDVFAIDSADNMVEAAKSNCNPNIHFITGDINKLSNKQENGFDLITSIMVMQFIEDLENTVQSIAKLLKKDGLVVIAVFNPEFVTNFVNVDVIFKDFDSRENPKKGFLCLSEELKVPTFIRTVEEYDEVFLSHGLKRVLKETPCFTKDFFNTYPVFVDGFFSQYPKKKPEDICEFLILGYTKE